MAYYKDLREFVKFLEERGALYRYRDPINKETELIPFHRVQMRGLRDDQRMGILFEKPVSAKGRTYDMSVLVGMYSASEQIFIWGMGCETYQEAIERFCHGIANPIPPKVVEYGPVHEEVHTGDEIKELGLDEIPVPVEEVGFSGMVRFGMPMLTKDPETGIINLGAYNGFFRDRDRILPSIGTNRITIREHWRKYRERHEDMPVAIITGPVPAIMASAAAAIPYGQPGLDELTMAGGIVGEPIELVRCKTVPLEVPAHAELVIEGYISTEVLEPGTPFGEYPGYMKVERSMGPIMRVTAVTHRKNAMVTNVIVGMWPSESNMVSSFARNALGYHYLKYEKNLPVEEVYRPEAGAYAVCVIRLQEGVSPETANEVLQAAADHWVRSKYYFVVDHDIDVRDTENLLWALAYRTQPQADFNIVPGGGGGGLDPSGGPVGSGRRVPDSSSRVSEENAADREYHRVLINATRKWAYPPVALPKKEYMERALEMWKARGDLPEPRMRWPWYGYTLGYWPEDLEEYAELMIQGKYREVGERMEKLQQPVREELIVSHRPKQ